MKTDFNNRQASDISDDLDYVNGLYDGMLITPSVLKHEKDDLEAARKFFIFRFRLFFEALKNGTPPLKESFEINLLSALNRLHDLLDSDAKQQVLDPDQLTVVASIVNTLEKDKDSWYSKLHCGFGKTITYLELARVFDMPTLIVVPGRDLTEQAKDEEKKFSLGLDIDEIKSKSKEQGGKVKVITYHSFREQVEDGRLNPEDWQLLILDEAHKALSERRKAAVRKFTKCVKLGFTATPEYSKNKKVADLLGEEAHTVTLRDGILAGKKLCGVKTMFVVTDIDISTVNVGSTGKLNPAELEKKINVSKRNHAAIKLYREQFSGQKGFVNCNGVVHAIALANDFNQDFKAAGLRYKAASFTGEDSPTVRHKKLRDLRKGRIKILIGDELLITGIDVPSICFVLNVSPTLSPVVAEQRGSRALRKNKYDPSKVATVVDFIDQTGDKFRTITFAEIIDGAELYPRQKHAQKNRSPKKEQAASTTMAMPEVDGIKFLLKPDEVVAYRENQRVMGLEAAPAGWKTVKGFCTDNSLNHGDYGQIFFDVFQKASKWITEGPPRQYFQDKNGHLGYFFHPYIIAHFQKIVPFDELKPIKELCAEFNVAKNELSALLVRAIFDIPSFDFNKGEMVATAVEAIKLRYGPMPPPGFKSNDYILLRNHFSTIYQNEEIYSRKRKINKFAEIRAKALSIKPGTKAFYSVEHRQFYIHKSEVAAIETDVVSTSERANWACFMEPANQHYDKIFELPRAPLFHDDILLEVISEHPELLRYNFTSGRIEIKSSAIWKLSREKEYTKPKLDSEIWVPYEEMVKIEAENINYNSPEKIQSNLNAIIRKIKKAIADNTAIFAEGFENGKRTRYVKRDVLASAVNSVRKTIPGEAWITVSQAHRSTFESSAYFHHAASKYSSQFPQADFTNSIGIRTTFFDNELIKAVQADFHREYDDANLIGGFITPKAAKIFNLLYPYFRASFADANLSKQFRKVVSTRTINDLYSALLKFIQDYYLSLESKIKYDCSQDKKNLIIKSDLLRDIKNSLEGNPYNLTTHFNLEKKPLNDEDPEQMQEYLTRLYLTIKTDLSTNRKPPPYEPYTYPTSIRV